MALPNPKVPPIQFYRRRLPDSCISFCSDEGKTLFAEALHAGHLGGYFGLAAQFRTQDEPAFCGLSTLVMVLNTLEVDPQRVWRGPWRWYHEGMLDCCVPLPIVKEKGINFNQFACLAACNSLNVKMTRATQSVSDSEFREAVKNTTKLGHLVIVATYSRKVLNQTGDGHFSPIGGYHPGRDLVLILDTARFKYPPHWVPLSLLWKAMQAVDNETGLTRGYFELSRREISSLVVFRVSSALTLQLSCTSANAHISSMQVFLETWSCWLKASSENESPGREIAVRAVECMTRAMTGLPDGEFFLTTQIGVNSIETLSSEHCCAALGMVSAIEKLPLFSLAKKYEHTIPDKVCSCQSKCQVVNGAGMSSDAQCGLSELTPVHFVTVLLLSWPKVGRGYGACTADCESGCGHRDGESRQSNGKMLQKYVQEQLVNSAEILRHEIDQLQQQLTSLMTYCRQCCDR